MFLLGIRSRLGLFLLGVCLKAIAFVSLIMELNLVPIHARKAGDYLTVFLNEVPVFLFLIGLICVIVSFYMPLKSKK